MDGQSESPELRPSGMGEGEPSIGLRDPGGPRRGTTRLRRVFRWGFDAVSLVLGVVAIVLAVHASCTIERLAGRASEHSDSINEVISNVRELTIIPGGFNGVMDQVTLAMTHHSGDTGRDKDLNGYLIVTDVLGYGHFSFPDRFEAYENFLLVQPSLQLACLSSTEVQLVLDGQFRFTIPEDFPHEAAERFARKVRAYVEKYSRDKRDVVRNAFQSDPSCTELVRLVESKKFLQDEVGSPQLAKELQDVRSCILAVDAGLFTTTFQNGKAEGYRFDGPSPLHVWWFSETEVYFALTDASGKNVHGFKSQKKELNHALRAIALRTIERAKAASRTAAAAPTTPLSGGDARPPASRTTGPIEAAAPSTSTPSR